MDVIEVEIKQNIEVVFIVEKRIPQHKHRFVIFVASLKVLVVRDVNFGIGIHQIKFYVSMRNIKMKKVLNILKTS